MRVEARLCRSLPIHLLAISGEGDQLDPLTDAKTQRTAHLVAVEVRQPDVDENVIRLAPEHELDAGPTTLGCLHLDAPAPQGVQGEWPSTAFR